MSWYSKNELARKVAAHPFTVNELVRGVAIALERAPVDDCAVLDSDANGAVTVDELLGAVGNLLEGCSDAQPLSRPPAALIRNPSWDFVSEADDPFLDARPADWFCDPTGIRFKVLSGFPSLEVDTAFCGLLPCSKPWGEYLPLARDQRRRIGQFPG